MQLIFLKINTCFELSSIFPLISKCESQQEDDTSHCELTSLTQCSLLGLWRTRVRRPWLTLWIFHQQRLKKTDTTQIGTKNNTTHVCSRWEQHFNSWWPNTSPSLKTPLTVNDSSVFCKWETVFRIIKEMKSKGEEKADQVLTGRKYELTV